VAQVGAGSFGAINEFVNGQLIAPNGTGLARLMEKHELFFWIGLLIWAVGYMMREQAGKTKTSELKNDETKD